MVNEGKWFFISTKTFFIGFGLFHNYTTTLFISDCGLQTLGNDWLKFIASACAAGYIVLKIFELWSCDN